MTDRKGGYEDLDLYSDSKRGKNPQPKDIYSHSGKKKAAPANKAVPKKTPPSPKPARWETPAQPEEIDCYNYVDDTIYTKPLRKPKGERDGKRRKRHRTLKIVLSVLLVLVLVTGGGLTAVYAQMDRSGNTDQSKYAAQPSAAPAWEVLSDPLVTNILLIGADQLDEGAQRADSMMLLSIDHKHHALKLTSFLRDMYLAVPENGMDKLNAAFAFGGPAMTMQTLENNFRIKIDKYIAVDMDGLAEIITLLGGIDVEMSEAMTYEMNLNRETSYSPGPNHLTGGDAVYYARIRYVDSDFGRTSRQREVITKMLKKLTTTNPFELSGLLSKLLPNLKTNIPSLELTGITFLSLPALFYGQKSFSVPADGTYSDDTVDVGMVLVPDLPENCRQLRKFIYEIDSPAA